MLLFCAVTAHAQLAVTVSPVKITGQKAVVLLAMTNNLAVSVDSARAICFLLDDQGNLLGQSSRWVIGGTKDRPPLEPKSGTVFNFVITSRQPFNTTNLTARTSFGSIVLAGQKIANPKTEVRIEGMGHN